MEVAIRMKIKGKAISVAVLLGGDSDVVACQNGYAVLPPMRSRGWSSLLLPTAHVTGTRKAPSSRAPHGRDITAPHGLLTFPSKHRSEHILPLAFSLTLKKLAEARVSFVSFSVGSAWSHMSLN